MTKKKKKKRSKFRLKENIIYNFLNVLASVSLVPYRFSTSALHFLNFYFFCDIRILLYYFVKNILKHRAKINFSQIQATFLQNLECILFTFIAFPSLIVLIQGCYHKSCSDNVNKICINRFP